MSRTQHSGRGKGRDDRGYAVDHDRFDIHKMRGKRDRAVERFEQEQAGDVHKLNPDICWGCYCTDSDEYDDPMPSHGGKS